MMNALRAAGCSATWRGSPASVQHALVPVVQPIPQRSSRRSERSVAVQSGRPVTQPVVPQVFVEGGDGDPIMASFQEHQKTAARPEPAQLARTWVALARYGVLATIDSKSGFPTTSVVEFASDPQGRVMFAVSTLSPHTADLSSSGRFSLCVTSPAFANLSDGRTSLQGTVRAVKDDERPALREIYLKKYPTAFYVDFGDFKWFILDELKAVRFNGGFAMAPSLKPEDYMSAQPDPVAAFSAPVCGHMNADHGADTLAMVSHYTGLSDAEAVKLLDLDRLGLNAEVTRKGQKFKLRLPFPRPAEDRKSIKDLIVEMTRAGRAAAAPPAAAETKA